MGRLTRDPELRRTQSGIGVCTITLAVDRDFQSREAREGGEKQTDFIDVVAWDRQAEFVTKYLTKGTLVAVEGSLQSRKWTDKMGQSRTQWEVRASAFHFAESKRDRQAAGYGAPPPYGSAPSSYGGGQPSYNASSSYGGGGASGYGSGAGGGESYTTPGSGDNFTEIEEDGELPF